MYASLLHFVQDRQSMKIKAEIIYGMGVLGANGICGSGY